MSGSIIKRAEGSYTIIYYLTDTNGVRKQKWKAIKGTKKQAQAELNRINHELNSGTFVADAKMTVRDFGARWLRDYGRDNLAPSTLEDYANALRLYVYPTLGSRDLASIRTMDVQALYSRLRESGSSKGQPLAPASVRVVHRILRRMFGHAVQWQLLPRNPAADATAPSGKSEERPILESAEAVEKVLQAAEGTWMYLPVLLAVSLALRRGEVLALRWRNVDLDERQAKIAEQVRETRARGVEITAPKTAAGDRVVPLPSFVVEELRRLRAFQVERLEQRGQPWSDERLLVSRINGEPFRPEGLSHAFGRIAEQAGYPEITFHDLRHTSITFLLERGVPIHVVSKIAGHASVQVTLTVYAHVLGRMKQAAIAEMDDLLPGRKTIEQSAPEKRNISKTLAEAETATPKNS